MSQDPHGCRRVQHELDAAETDAQREAIARELHGRALAASHCPHANHVLQKIIVTLRPRAVQFIVDELAAASIRELARHKYGCRIVQRLMEQCAPSQVADIQSELLEDICGLTVHPYGTFVMQAILRHGGPQHRAAVSRALRGNFRKLSAEPSSCAVLGTLLETAGEEEGEELASALVCDDGLLPFMASIRHGASAVIRALELLRRADREAALMKLASELAVLRDSRHGQELVDYVEAHAAKLLSVAACAGA